ncbi:MAG: ribosomal protein S18-alanine N-acetyltransferase [Ktedonobacterales bacterium]
MRYSVDRMTMADLSRVVEIEKLAYPSPWPPSAYRKELQENRHAHYIVVRDAQIALPAPVAQPDQVEVSKRHFPLSLLPARLTPPLSRDAAAIVGFAGLWLMVDEAHVTTIAVHPAYRGRRLGELLLNSLTGIAYEISARRVTLEVRVSNTVAQNLYRKYGFEIAGLRRRYYSDNNEDAYIMTTDEIHSQPYRERFVGLRDDLMARLTEGSGAGGENDGSGDSGEQSDTSRAVGQSGASGTAERSITRPPR